jgi:antitoxin MazE
LYIIDGKQEEDMVITRVKLWGNSLALRIPSAFAKQLGLEPDTPVELVLSDDGLCARLVQESFPTLDELLAQVTPENQHAETDWGPAVGREVW